MSFLRTSLMGIKRNASVVIIFRYAYDFHRYATFVSSAMVLFISNVLPGKMILGQAWMNKCWLG